jgi:hypothetical protein
MNYAIKYIRKSGNYNIEVSLPHIQFGFVGSINTNIIESNRRQTSLCSEILFCSRMVSMCGYIGFLLSSISRSRQASHRVCFTQFDETEFLLFLLKRI